MKKLICVFLMLTLAMSLWACGQTAPETEATPRKPAANAEPTQEEKSLLKSYVQTVNDLNHAARKSAREPQGNPKDVQKAWEQLFALDLDTVSMWAETTWAQWAYTQCREPSYFRFPEDFDCEAVLARFEKVEDVKLRYTTTTVDHMGNVSNALDNSAWHYGANGELRYAEKEFVSDPMAVEWIHTTDSAFDYHRRDGQAYEYDEAGRIAKISYYSGSNVSVARIFTYDGEGKLITQTAKANTQERVYQYSYDGQGRLTKVRCEHPALGSVTCIHETLYTYNAAGKPVKEELTLSIAKSTKTEITNRYIREYGYDAAGKLATGTYTEEEWITGLKNEVMKQRVDQYTYELDAQDRVVRTIVIPGDTMHLPGNKVSAKANYAQIISETTYGDYYIYTPAE